jgi:hypothetical protein
MIKIKRFPRIQYDPIRNSSIYTRMKAEEAREAKRMSHKHKRRKA